MFEKTVLSNGLRVVSSTLPHTRSVSINIYIGAGSRYESDCLLSMRSVRTSTSICTRSTSGSGIPKLSEGKRLSVRPD